MATGADQQADGWGDSLADDSDTGGETDGWDEPTVGDSGSDSDGDEPDLSRRPLLCGNGEVDPGEDCDDEGQSEICDIDCTAPECGDGLVNPDAGEVCDPGVEDGPACDETCEGPM